MRLEVEVPLGTPPQHPEVEAVHEVVKTLARVKGLGDVRTQVEERDGRYVYVFEAGEPPEEAQRVVCPHCSNVLHGLHG